MFGIDLAKHGDVYDYFTEKGYDSLNASQIVGSLVQYIQTGGVTISDYITVKQPTKVKEGDSYKTIEKETEVPTLKFKSKKLYDALSEKELRDLYPMAVQYILRQEIETQMPFTSLFDSVPYNGSETNIVVTDIPPIEVNEVHGEAYPKFDIAIGTSESESVNIMVKKFGGLLSVTKAFANNQYASTYLNIIFRKIANAFARKKEAVAQQSISKMGKVTLYDNDTPASADLGATSGRSIDGGWNNTLSPYDLMNAYVHGYTNYNMYYDTLVMHPFAWTMFMMTPQLKELLVGNDGTLKFPMEPSGSPAQGWPQYKPYSNLYPQQNNYGTPNPNNPEFEFDPNVLSKLGVNPYDVYPGFMWSKWQIPPSKSGFFNHPLNIILTPTVPFAKSGTSYKTDLILASSGNIGAVFQAQNVRVREKNRTDEFEDVILYKFDEIYGVYPYFRGEGFGLIKNVQLDKQYVFENVNSVALSPDTNTDTRRGVFKL